MNLRALLTSPLGFLIGVSLGALGGGGSILAVPVLVYAAGQPARSATTTSLILVGIASLVGMASHWRAGRVRVGTGVVFGLTGIGGSLAGSALNQRIDPDVLLLSFAGLVCVAAWRMLTGCPTCTKVGEATALRQGSAEAPSTLSAAAMSVRRRVDVRSVLTVLAAGTAVGFLTGLFGVGGGFVIVPALTLVLKLPMPEAIGTSLLVIAINAAVALSTRLATTSIDWGITLPFVISAIAGVLAGGRVADRLDPRRSLRWFAALLVAVAVYTAVRATASLVS
ncbi:sulfite exporter TauE/SafE family protein [Desertimonas flava]|uniref:sulfite exporter TauE/SafE family protein n=1 Tax=Desertimonas flava TaxID=2064846 RepID=UPI000E3520F2|nr:sulfite exporter TauE/SafE family protein [Desertimonas flava]